MKRMLITMLQLVLFLVVSSRAAGEVTAKPNIIFILVDDMGYSDLGAYGGEVNTPNIDSLAKNGLRFTQCYNSARCCPSRASLLTGLYSHQAGIADFTGSDFTKKKGPAYRGRLNKTCVTLAEVLKTSGYNTYCVGKWHVGQKESPIARGFDAFYGYTKGHSAGQWDEENYYRLPKEVTPEIDYSKSTKPYFATDVFSDYAVEFIKQGQASKKPFFLYLAHSSPHFPLHARPEMRDKYLATYRQGWDKLREARYEKQKKIGLVTDSWKFTDTSEVPVEEDDDIANGFGGKNNPTWDSLSKERQEDLTYRMATFAAMVEHVDEGVGRIIEQLEQNGDLNNTLIILTSDNGACYEWGPFGFDTRSRKAITKLHKGDELKTIGSADSFHSVGSGWSSLSNTPLRMYKHFNHEGGNCSPLVAHWPKGIKGEDRWVRSPIHLIDMMPTLRNVSGSEYPETFGSHKITPEEGISFVPVFERAVTMPERMIWFDHYEASALRLGDWKLVRGNKRYNDRKWELYNIGKDRCETNDLIESKPELSKKMEAMWLEKAKELKVAPYYKHKKMSK